MEDPVLASLKNISEEDIKRYQQKLEEDEKRKQRYIKYIADMSATQRADFIRKVIKKYSSDEYIDREYKNGYEPRTTLYFLLFDYAEEYGIPSEYDHNGYFPEEQYDIDGKFIISVIYGQGSICHITEVPDSDIIPHIFKEEPVEIYNPDGKLICNTTEQATLLDIQKQIRDKHLEGYYVIYQDNKFNILPSGFIRVTNENGDKFTFSQITYNKMKDLTNI